MDSPLLTGTVIAAAVVATGSVINQILTNATNRQANKINANRLAMEQETARHKEEAEQQEIEKKRRDELRNELAASEKRRDELEDEIRESERKLLLREALCTSRGSPCQQPLVIQIETKPPAP